MPCFEWRPANDRCWTLGKSTDGILPTTSQKASCLTGKLSGVLTPKGHVHRCRPSSIPFQSQMKPWDPMSDTSPLRLGNDELGGSHLPLPERCPPPLRLHQVPEQSWGTQCFLGAPQPTQDKDRCGGSLQSFPCPSAAMMWVPIERAQRQGVHGDVECSALDIPGPFNLRACVIIADKLNTNNLCRFP